MGKFVLAACILLLSAAAVAQPGPSAPEVPFEPTTENSEAQTPAPAGELRVLIFIEDEPAQGVSLEIPKAGSARSNKDGSVALSGPPGRTTPILRAPRHLFPAIGLGEGEPDIVISLEPLDIVARETIEVIVALDLAGKLVKVDVEAPGETATEVEGEASFEQRMKLLPIGIVRGRVFTGPSNRPVEGAGVFVRGAPRDAKTNANGEFELELPEGSYDLVVIHPKFTTAKLKGVEIDANRPKEVRVAVEEATPALDDFVVTAPHIEGGVASLVAERRESASVDEVIGAEEMSRSGDSDAAGALRRVTGITVIGGQFVYVRGMGERYSATLLNGQSIPSPEPERRVIPLDLFSTNILESVVIQKTPSPDLPAEFGGGVVLLRTKSFPDEFTLSASAGTGMVSNATFRGRPDHVGGSLDFLGTDDGSRELPSEIRNKSPLREGNQFQPGLSPDELAAMGRLLKVNYDVEDKTVAPDTSISLSVGDSFKLKKRPMGYLVSLSHGRNHNFKEEINRRFIASDTAEGGLELNNDFQIGQLSQTVSGSGIFVAGFEPEEGDEVKATTLLLRITDNETAQVTGRSDDLGQDIERSRLRFVERQLFTQQLVGKHQIDRLNKGIAEWRYSFSRATRDEPDRREYFYADESANPDEGPSDFQVSARPAGNQRVWSDLSDRVHDIGGDYAQPFSIWSGLTATAKVGASAVFRERDYDTLRLTLRAPRMLSAEERRLAPNEIWGTDRLNAENGWILEDTTQPTDAYQAEQQIQAAYSMVDLPITEAFEVRAGARVERSRQKVVTFSPFDTDAVPLQTELDNTDVLPSILGKYQLSDRLVLRGGYGRTVTRPDFRELSESQFRDVVTATRFVGNPELVRGTIDNIDARVEYYFSSDQLVSLSSFYKSFESPIEQIDLGGVDRSVSWDNADSATNIGLELESRGRLGFISEQLADGFASVNVAMIKSEVVLGEDSSGVSTSKQRALQGQSPYVVNLQLGYDDASVSGVTAVLLYNVFGERIRDVGRLGSPDIFEKPLHQLDFVYSQRLGEHWKLKFKAKNLLDQDIRFTQGIKVARRFRRGRSFSLSAAWNWGE